MVEGAPDAEQGDIDLALGRLDATRGWWMRPDPLGLPSQNELARARPLARRERWPLSNSRRIPAAPIRLRVHAQAMGWPILGDPVYGHGRREGAPPLHLHARSIVIPMQESKPPVCVEAPAPSHMRSAMLACGWSGETEAQLQKSAEAATLTK